MNIIRSTIRKTGRKDQRGLTLVEMMVVLVILGLLTTIVVINVLPAADQADMQKARADISTLEVALDQYRLDMKTYPTMAQGLQALVSVPDGVNRAEAYRPGGYIRKLPLDPWGNPYVYQTPGENGQIDIY
ncbi:MAG: type II secretion system major pseudopilin GspG, partial [Aquisalinus sp.]|nr:type II secretion system major pseudopilin GspG [Aquisalinus sp.]